MGWWTIGRWSKTFVDHIRGEGERIHSGAEVTIGHDSDPAEANLFIESWIGECTAAPFRLAILTHKPMASDKHTRKTKKEYLAFQAEMADMFKQARDQAGQIEKNSQRKV